MNRGFVSGPFCTIYGFGAISVYLILKPIENHVLLLFLGGHCGCHSAGIYYGGSDGEYFFIPPGGITVTRNLIFRDVSAWEFLWDGEF